MEANDSVQEQASIQEDLTLIAGIQANDPRAETRFYEKYRERVLFFFRKKMNHQHEEDAQDFCLETLAAAMRAAKNGKIENAEKLSGYIYGICQNKLREWIRAKDNKPKPTSTSDHENTIAVDPQIEEEVINRDLIDRAIHRLNKKEREIFDLKFSDGWSYEKIGDILKLKPANVRQTARRALQKMKNFLAES